MKEARSQLTRRERAIYRRFKLTTKNNLSPALYLESLTNPGFVFVCGLQSAFTLRFSYFVRVIAPLSLCLEEVNKRTNDPGNLSKMVHYKAKPGSIGFVDGKVIEMVLGMW